MRKDDAGIILKKGEGKGMRIGIGYCLIVLYGILRLGSVPVFADTYTVLGKVVDAISRVSIAGATLSTDTGGYLTTTDVNGDYLLSVSVGEFLVTASATGYISASKPITIGKGESGTLDFELVPIPFPTLTPTTTATPIFTCTEPGLIELSSTRVKLKRKQNHEVTVTLTCEDGSPLEGQTVIAKINTSGKKRIAVTPNAVTDASGEATFTITAKKKTGISRILFEAGSLKKKATVKISR
jgi:hypothetical protein